MLIGACSNADWYSRLRGLRTEAVNFLDLAQVNVVRSGRQVLQDVCLTVRQGEQIALLGPNGCGKSTLLKVISGELYPLALPQTRVKVFGRERWDLTELKRRLGVVQNELPGKPMLKLSAHAAVLTGFFSSSNLWPNLIVTSEMQEAADRMLVRVGAEDLRARTFGELSAGQQRRVLIGRALIGSAGCLLLDEPSNALDLQAQRELRMVLMELAEQGTTLIHITHHIADIIPAVQRVVLMQDGRIVDDGPRQKLLTESRLSELFRTQVHLTERDGILHAS